jgi:Tol biopolymer transport system component
LAGLRIRFLSASLVLLSAGCAGVQDVSTGTANTISAERLSIVFTSKRDGKDHIYVMKADGSDQRILSTKAINVVFDDTLPACSADGSKIAFARSRDGYSATVWTMSSDGSRQFELTSTTRSISILNPFGLDQWQKPIGDADWSPDRTRIVYSDYVQGTWVVDSNDNGETELDPYTEFPAWSPDGSKIVSDSRSDIVVTSADGSDPVYLTRDTSRKGALDWSPDGSRIVFESAGRDGKFDADIFVMDADGTGIVRLTTDAGQDTWPSWSPDGSKIAFTSNRDGSDAEVYVMNADGTDQVALTDNQVDDGQPCWLVSS